MDPEMTSNLFHVTGHETHTLTHTEMWIKEASFDLMSILTLVRIFQEH